MTKRTPPAAAPGASFSSRGLKALDGLSVVAVGRKPLEASQWAALLQDPAAVPASPAGSADAPAAPVAART